MYLILLGSVETPLAYLEHCDGINRPQLWLYLKSYLNVLQIKKQMS